MGAKTHAVGFYYKALAQQIDKGENSCYTIIVKKLSNVAKAQKMSYNRHRSAYCIMIAVYSREGYR